MERYLRAFTNYFQDDWYDLLPAAEFASNAAHSTATQITPFKATRGLNPRISFELPTPAATAKERITKAKAESITNQMQKVWQWARKHIAKDQEKMSAQANKKRRNVTFQEGQKVWLSAKDIQTERPCKKLDHKWLGPFKVLKVVAGGTDCKLELPASMLIYDTFHVSKLALDPEDPLPGQGYEEPPPVVIKDQKEWDVEEILDIKRGRGKHSNNNLLARVR